MLNFQHAIQYYQLEVGSFLELVVLKLIPFIGEFVADAFSLNNATLSSILDQAYYFDVGYGMASSPWGLAYYVAGPLGCILFLILFLCIVFVLNSIVLRNSMWAHHLIGPSVFLCFYSSRLEIGSLAYFFYFNIVLLYLYRIAYSLLRKHPVRTTRFAKQYIE